VLVVGISNHKVRFILDADIRNFFGAVSQDWLVRFVEHRIGDARIIRLIQKWLKAGVLEDGIVTTSETGRRLGRSVAASPSCGLTSAGGCMPRVSCAASAMAISGWERPLPRRANHLLRLRRVF